MVAAGAIPPPMHGWPIGIVTSALKVWSVNGGVGGMVLLGQVRVLCSALDH
jgi:hypothetical protein